MSRRIAVRRSPIHGRGVFALRPLRAGETVIEYRGEVIPWSEAIRRAEADPDGFAPTMLFDIGDGGVIDGSVGGNSSRWINHSCEPNCRADDEGGRILIRAASHIAAGQELTFDYRLTLDEDEDTEDAETRALYACACGSARCRGTMLDV